MEVGTPLVVLQIALLDAEELLVGPVHEVIPAFGIAHPEDDGSAVRHGTEARLALLERVFRLSKSPLGRFGFPAQGHVPQGTRGASRRSVLRQREPGMNLDPKEAVGLLSIPDLVEAVVLLAPDERSEQLEVPLPIVRVDEVEKGVAEALLPREAGDLRPGRVQVGPVPFRIRAKYDVSDVVQGEADVSCGFEHLHLQDGRSEREYRERGTREGWQ